MRFSVRWMPRATTHLAELWLDADPRGRRAITAAVREIDSQLGAAPISMVSHGLVIDAWPSFRHSGLNTASTWSIAWCELCACGDSAGPVDD